MGNYCPKDRLPAGNSSLARIPHNALTVNRKKCYVDKEDFIKICQLGRGEFSVVYKVQHKSSNKIYAMRKMVKSKIFKNKLQSDIVLERNVLKQSKHPFLVRLKFTFETYSYIYFVMEYIEGGEFYKILDLVIPEHVVKFIAAEVVLALEYLNTKLNVIYRELKPENLLLTTTGHVKLTDFGLVILRKDEDVKILVPEYQAPEIINKLEHSFEVDLWTLGILIYELINRQPPFTAPDMNKNKIFKLIEQNKPIYPQIMSAEAIDLVSRLLKTNPKERIGANGYDEIKNHPFFSEIQWSELQNLSIESPLMTFVEEYAILKQSSNAFPVSRQKVQVGQKENFIKLRELGRGAFGKVYKVQHRGSNKIYAMRKMVKSKIFKNKLQTNTVLEKNVLKQSKHPLIERLKFTFHNKSHIFFVTEYLEGGEFYKILDEVKTGLPQHVVQFVAAEVVLALEYLNTKLNIVYIDLKPENILYTRTGHVKLTDFGLATLRKDLKNITPPEYQAPELITEFGLSFAVDLWTLGILIYELINRKTPFLVPYRNPLEILLLVLQNKPIYPQIMSAEAVDLVSRLLKTNPRERIGANGYDEIKNHPFFSKIQWSELQNLSIKSPLKTFVDVNYLKTVGPRMPQTLQQKQPKMSYA